MRRLALLLLLLPLAPGAARGGPLPEDPAPAATTPAAAVEVDPSVQELFDETGDDGAPVVGAALQDYYRKLPLHARQLLVQALEDDMVSSAGQLRGLLALGLNTDAVELLLRDNCILCHTNPDYQDEEALFVLEGEAPDPRLDLRPYLSDVHMRHGLSCAGCHGGSPDDLDMADEIYERWPSSPERHEDRGWIPGFCGRCHADPAFMRGYAPRLPTDQLAKYRTSRHGIRLLEEGDSRAAQCVSCHGVHGIRRGDSRLSLTHPQNIPSTCGRCHSDPQLMAGYTLADGSPLPVDQEAKYRRSVHGVALLERGDLGAPDCSDCHGNHSAMPPEVASVAQVCRNCHSANGSLFDGSKHKQQFEAHGWPECGKCHGEHAIARTSDAMLWTGTGGLCHDCHQDYATGNEDCERVATYFHETLRWLDREDRLLHAEIERLASRGLDVEPLEGTASQLHDALRQSRSRIHSFDRSDFDEVADVGREAVVASQGLIGMAEQEFATRTKGLLAAILSMVFLAVVLSLKLRQLEGGAKPGPR